MLLPNKKGGTLLKTANRVLHDGGHLGEYFGKLEQRVLKIQSLETSGRITKSQALEEMLALQREVRKGLKEGTIALHEVDRARIAKGEVVVIACVGLVITSEDSYGAVLDREVAAATLEFVERDRQKNTYVKFVTAEHYTKKSTYGPGRWVGTGLDFFNPVTDVIFVTDVIEDIWEGTVTATEPDVAVVGQSRFREQIDEYNAYVKEHQYDYEPGD